MRAGVRRRVNQDQRDRPGPSRPAIAINTHIRIYTRTRGDVHVADVDEDAVDLGGPAGGLGALRPVLHRGGEEVDLHRG